MIDPDSVTLGILAGGRASRLGGIDKAWLVRDGRSQVERIAACFAGVVDATIVSANRDLERYVRQGLVALADHHVHAGPMGGLHALAGACSTPWLFTVPVDIVRFDRSTLERLTAGASPEGAFASDDDGPQPLLAMWRVGHLRDAVATAIARRALAVHALQAQLHMSEVRLGGIRLGNLNTPADLIAADIGSGTS